VNARIVYCIVTDLREAPSLVNISLIGNDSRVRKKINFFLSLTGNLIGS
jgi:hypothetical protein